MAASSAARIIRAPGRLVADPTNLTVAYPHGGTELGLVRLVIVQPLGSPFRVESEGLGEATDVLDGPEHYVFGCMLRGWDDDAVQTCLADHYTAGAISGHALFSAPGNAHPGGSAIPRAHAFLYVPDDVVNVPAVILYRGIPDWSDGAEMAMQRGDELGLAISIECLRNDDGHILQIGRMADLSLT